MTRFTSLSAGPFETYQGLGRLPHGRRIGSEGAYEPPIIIAAYELLTALLPSSPCTVNMSPAAHHPCDHTAAECALKAAVRFELFALSRFVLVASLHWERKMITLGTEDTQLRNNDIINSHSLPAVHK